MSAHTPGPWVWKADGGIYSAAPNTLTRFVATVYHYSPEIVPNARLIAAAPDLLAACKMVADMAVGWGALTPGDIAEVKAAIAKAEGR